MIDFLIFGLFQVCELDLIFNFHKVIIYYYHKHSTTLSELDLVS